MSLMRKGTWPFVTRRRLRRCMAERDAALEAKADIQDELPQLRSALLGLPETFANRARLAWLKPPVDVAAGELCLFVTHLAVPRLKLHVVDHVNELVAAGVAVILIVNTDLDTSEIDLPSELLAVLQGCAIRQNIGFDFAAWSHVFSLVDMSRVERLYLVNDSVIGPLDRSAFTAMMERIRGSDADMVGLTENSHPQWHLQSYFLVINQGLLRTDTFSELMRHIVNLPTKQAVINNYEIQISLFLMARKFRCTAIFPSLDPDSQVQDDTYFRWSELVESGFPFVKASVLRRVLFGDKAAELVPARYRDMVASGGVPQR